MSDDIKFNSTSRELLSLRKGNIYLGVGDSPKGPTSLTGFKSTLNLATASTIIALHRGDGAFSWYRNYSDEELISRTNRIDNSVQRTTKEECYSYFSGQSDKIILNRDYEKIITDNLVLNVDAGFLPSYPATGSIWYDTGSESHGTFENSPTYNTSGWLSFNGTNQLVNFGNILSFSSVNSFTIELWFLWDGTSLTPDSFYHLMGVGQNYYQLVIDRSAGDLCRVSFRVNNNDIFINTGAHDIYSNTWNHVVATYQPGVESKIYLNGVLKNTGSGVSTLQSSGNFFQLGGVNTDATFFPGSISIGRVYTKVLSDVEVLNNFNNQQVRYNITTTTSTTTSGVTTTTSTTTSGVTTTTSTTTTGGGIVPFILRIDTTRGGQNPGLAESNLVFVDDLYYDFIVDWGDAQTESIMGLGSQIVGGNGRLSHYYSEPGLYDIQIFSNLPFALKTLNDDGSIKYNGKEWREIVQWGNCVWYTLRGAFGYMVDLQITATDTPNLSQCLSFQSAFFGCENLTGGNIGSWNIGSSPATSFRDMFYSCTNFNANLNNWDVSNGVDFFMMFFFATSFNSPLNNWNVCNATEMNWMLRNTAFDQDISSWKVPLILEEPANFCVASPFCSDPSKKPQWGVSC